MIENEALSILSRLERRGWRAMPTSTGWQMERKPDEGRISMSITPQRWLCFSSPFLEEQGMVLAPLTTGDAVRLYRSFLEQNEQMFVTKFALDKDDTTVLMSEVTLTGEHPQLAYWALESIARYKVKKMQNVLMEAELAQATEEITDAPSVLKIRVLERNSPTLPTVLTGIADDTISLFLKGVTNWGWRIKEKAKAFTWQLSYLGPYHWFDVYLTTSKNWIYFQVPMLLDRVATVLTQPDQTEETQQQQLFFLKYLLRLNHHYFMAKLALSADNQVLLMLELPTENLDFVLFRQAILAIGTYIDRFEQEIQIMASLQHNKRLLELLRV